MNKLEHYMTIAAEECAEVAQRLSKAARFGLAEVQPDQPLNNAERIRREFVDLYATLQLIEIEACLDPGSLCVVKRGETAAKRRRIAEYLEVSRCSGTLS